MKKLFSLILAVLLVAFLVVTNPTVEEYAQWYADQSLSGRDSAMEALIAQFIQHMASNAKRTDYLVCSVFTYDGHDTLGVGLLFFPLDELNDQIQVLRDEYAQWLTGQSGN